MALQLVTKLTFRMSTLHEKRGLQMAVRRGLEGPKEGPEDRGRGLARRMAMHLGHGEQKSPPRAWGLVCAGKE